jgi:hypothetical protein
MEYDSFLTFQLEVAVYLLIPLVSKGSVPCPDYARGHVVPEYFPVCWRNFRSFGYALPIGDAQDVFWRMHQWSNWGYKTSTLDVLLEEPGASLG